MGTLTLQLAGPIVVRTVQAPPDWAQASLTGIYIGIEVWGRGRVWMEHQYYRVWSPS